MRIAEKKAKILAEISELERQLQNLNNETRHVEGKLIGARRFLNLIEETEAEQASLQPKREADNLLQMPAISLSEAVRKGVIALKRFTREDVGQWVRSNYPQIDFNPKSIESPLRRLIDNGLVKMLRPNTGNKVPAIYGVVENVETELNKQEEDR